MSGPICVGSTDIGLTLGTNCLPTSFYVIAGQLVDQI